MDRDDAQRGVGEGAIRLIGGTLALLVVLPLTTSVICTACIRWYQHRGLRPLSSSELPRPVRHLSVAPVGRGPRLAIVSAATFGPVTVLVAWLGASNGLSRAGYIATQSASALLLGALITPLVALAAMAEPTSRTR